VIYCRSGARSYHTCQFLAQQGFDNVVNLRGGIIAWARHGYEIGRIAPA
jgi:rhodanese-related sulfurtransferase